jgi:hypothetical protein
MTRPSNRSGTTCWRSDSNDDAERDDTQPAQGQEATGDPRVAGQPDPEGHQAREDGPAMHDRDRSQATAEPRSDHAPDCPADGRAGQQQPKADATKPQPLLSQQNQNRALGGGDDVEPSVPQRQRPQHPMREQPAQPLGDLRPQAGGPASCSATIRCRPADRWPAPAAPGRGRPGPG